MTIHSRPGTRLRRLQPHHVFCSAEINCGRISWCSQSSWHFHGCICMYTFRPMYLQDAYLVSSADGPDINQGDFHYGKNCSACKNSDRRILHGACRQRSRSFGKHCRIRHGVLRYIHLFSAFTCRQKQNRTENCSMLSCKIIFRMDCRHDRRGAVSFTQSSDTLLFLFIAVSRNDASINSFYRAAGKRNAQSELPELPFHYCRRCSGSGHVLSPSSRSRCLRYYGFTRLSEPCRP